VEELGSSRAGRLGFVHMWKIPPDFMISTLGDEREVEGGGISRKSRDFRGERESS